MEEDKSMTASFIEENEGDSHLIFIIIINMIYNYL